MATNHFTSLSVNHPEKTNPSAPDKVYLRTIKDLTLHGGINDFGELLIVPILSALGTNVKSSGDYRLQVLDVWKSGNLAQLVPQVPWAEPEGYSFRYPALTSELPLPSTTVIDHILSEDSGEGKRCFDADLAKNQLESVRKKVTWRSFILWGSVLPPNAALIETLLGLDGENPGILTEKFRDILMTTQSLYAQIELSLKEKKFVVVTSEEATQLATDLGPDDVVFLKKLLKWPSYFKNMVDRESSLKNLITSRKLLGLEISDESRKSYFFGEDSWLLLSDIGSQEYRRTARELNASQEGRFEYLEIDSQSDAKKTAIDLYIWQKVLDDAVIQDLLGSFGQDLAIVTQALSRRCSPDSIGTFAFDRKLSYSKRGPMIFTLASHKPVESIPAESSNPKVHIVPMVVRPEVAAVKESLWKKKFPTNDNRYESLRDLIERVQGNELVEGTLHYYDRSQQWVWPFGNLWQIADLAYGLFTMPELFLNPEFLIKQAIDVDLDFKELKPGDQVYPETWEWEEVFALLASFMGKLLSPLELSISDRLAIPDEGLPNLRVIEVELEASKVGLGVRFEALDAQYAGMDLKLLLDLVSRRLRSEGADLDSATGLLEMVGNIRFEPRPYFEVDGEEIDESTWFKAKKIKSGFYSLGNDKFVSEEVYLAKTHQFDLRKKVYLKFQNLGLSDLWKVQMRTLEETNLPTMAPEEYMRQVSLKVTPIHKQIDDQTLVDLGQQLLKGKLSDLIPILRPYQIHGIAWAYLRLKLGLGVCLADEMGLGKTIQAIGLLRSLATRSRAEGSGNQPSLVVMPKTLKLNWLRELGQFGPNLSVAVWGEDCGRDGMVPDAVEVVLVTYPRLRLDEDILYKIDWNLVILDEAHAIKNAHTQISDAVKRLRCRHRIALTGTPVENRAAELWSLVDWLNPGYLGDQKSFSAYTLKARSSEQKKLLLAPLRICLDPLILRRLKADPQVALGLPDKIHQDTPCDLSQEQQILYQAVIEMCVAEVAEKTTLFQRKSIYLKAILHLKQICIHPELFFGEEDENSIPKDEGFPWSQKLKKLTYKYQVESGLKKSKFEVWLERSGKLAVLRDLIDDRIIQCRGILIFTQYLAAGEMVQRIVSQGDPSGAHGSLAPMIHGGLSPEHRQAMVDDFNAACRTKSLNQPAPILILSLKAGGTGLNLTGADCVIHLDRWWNPAVEDQATDRAHRIGQTSHVGVHTLTSQGTIEESIGEMFRKKRGLSSDLLGATTEANLADSLENREGFLHLVDPQGVFRKSLKAL